MPKRAEFKAKIEIGFQNKKNVESIGMFNMKPATSVVIVPVFGG